MDKEKWADELGLIRATIAGSLIGFSWKPDPKNINVLTNEMVDVIKKDIEKIVRKELRKQKKALLK